MERKTFPFELTKLNIEGRTLEGHAAVFNNVDRVNDIIHPGAFAKTIVERGQKVKFLWMHDPSEPIGRPIMMQEDNTGLFVRAIISDTQRGRDALALLRDEAIDRMSIGYDPITLDYVRQGDKTIRNLREVRLHEFSLVTFAANEQARVTALKEEEKQDTAPVVPPEQGHVCECEECGVTVTTTTSCNEMSCPTCGASMKETVAAVEPTKQDTYSCECIECGHTLESEEHCRSLRCPECAGEMRRVERPGSGKVVDNPLLEFKPYPNEHACRLRSPGGFQEGQFRRTTRRHDGKPYSIIMGRLEGETTMTEQAYRYPKDDWTAASARAHCRDHDGTFEAAAKPKEADGPEDVKEGRILSAKNRTLIGNCVREMGEAVAALQELLEATEPPAREKDLSAPDETQAALGNKEVEQKQTDSKEAEPDQPLTSVEDLRQALKVGILSLELMEVDDELEG